MFGRKKKASPDEVDEVEAPAEEVAAAEVDRTEPARPQGPWDEADAPADEVNRIDLGGLRVPVPPGHEVRVDVNPEGEVIAATLVSGPSAMQVNVFAAPRTSGIWDEVRTEIAASVTGSGGRVLEADSAVESAGRVDIDEAHVGRSAVDDRVRRVAGDENESARPCLHLPSILAEGHGEGALEHQEGVGERVDDDDDHCGGEEQLLARAQERSGAHAASLSCRASIRTKAIAA